MQYVLELFEEARLPFAMVLFLLNFAIAIEKIPFSMGCTRETFWTGFFASWGGKNSYVVTSF